MPENNNELTPEEMAWAESTGKKLAHGWMHFRKHTLLPAGGVAAMIVSYTTWKSVGWMLLHGCLGWMYVLYYLIRYASG